MKWFYISCSASGGLAATRKRNQIVPQKKTLVAVTLNANLIHLLKRPSTDDFLVVPPSVYVSRSARDCTHSHGPYTTVSFCSRATLPQVGNLTEVLVPYVKYRMRVRAEERSKIEGTAGKVQRTQAEKGFYLEQYDREFSLRFRWLAAAAKPSEIFRCGRFTLERFVQL